MTTSRLDRHLLRSLAIGVALLISLASVQALAGQGDDVAKLFGTRVQANSRFKAPVATGDFDGEGKPDALYLVSILPVSAVSAGEKIPQ